jgi:DNA-binding GntR family transcriptional regulator
MTGTPSPEESQIVPMLRRDLRQAEGSPIQESTGSFERRVPLRAQIYEQLEDLIVYGRLAPGEHLVEATIAKRLGVSRIPVREALQLLHRDGWVDLRPRQGAFVHQPTPEEVDDVFGVRTILEVESARTAACNAGEDSVTALRDIVDAGTTALAAGDDREVVLLNSLFHSRVTHIGGNRVLESLIARLDKRIRWYFAPVVRYRGQGSWREHAEIVDAIAGKDPERAAEVMRRHAENTRSAHHLALPPHRQGARDPLS